MKFSIVLPAYNVENYIEKMFACLLQQTYTDFELIVVDDCATDATGEIVDCYQKRFEEQGVSYTAIHKQQNEGLSMARNTGMEHASGEYVLFLDTDDLPEQTLLETVAGAMGKNRPDLLVYGFTEDYYKGEERIYRVGKEPVSHYFSNQGNGDKLAKAFSYITELERQTMFGYAWNKAYRLDFLREYKLRFEMLVHIEDIVFNVNVARHMQSMQTIPDMLYHYCNRGQARLTSKYLPQYFELQKKRFETFLSLQQEKISACRQTASDLSEAEICAWEQRMMETMAGAYFRAFQSFLVREITHGTPKRQILQRANAETEGVLYRKLRGFLSKEGKVAKVLYRPLAKGQIQKAYVRARGICFVQKCFPGLYTKLKQNR